MIGVLLAARRSPFRARRSPKAATSSKYTCDAGQTNPSPALAWKEAPAATKSFVLIMDDPDVRCRTASRTGCSPIFRRRRKICRKASRSARSGYSANSGFRGRATRVHAATGAHHYHFKLMALDHRHGGRQQGASRADVEKAMAGHVLAPPKRSGSIKSNLNSRWSFVVRRWSGLSRSTTRSFRVQRLASHQPVFLFQVLDPIRQHLADDHISSYQIISFLGRDVPADVSGTQMGIASRSRPRAMYW